MNEIEKQSKEACERQAILYTMDRLAQTESNNSTEELSDDFFDVTVNDLKFVLSDLKRAQSEDQPLITKAIRELEQVKI